MVALLREIERGFEPGRQLEQLPVDLGDALGHRAFELVERQPGLKRRDRIDEIRHGLRLNEIHATVQERP